MIDIVLVVDHKWRDLPGLVFLAHVLEQNYGLSVRLVPYNLWQKSLILDRPELLCVSVLYGKRGEEIIRVCREIGTKLVVIMTEGRPNNMEALKYSTGGGSNSKYADFWIAWSHTVKDFMLSEGVLPPEKIEVLGSLRFDIYSPPYNSIIMERGDFANKYALNPEKPIISWATNFTNAKFYKGNEDFLIKNWNDLGLTRFEAYSNPRKSAKLDYETRKTSSRIIKKLLSANEEIQIAVKPHPAEDHKFYLNFVKDCNSEFGGRVAFIGFDYIWNLLNAADIHLHRLCTTGVEAWFLDVPSIELHIKDYMPWSLELEGAAYDAAKGNDSAGNFAELNDLVRFYLKGGQVSQEKLKYRGEYIEKWLYKVDGNRIVEHAACLSKLIDNPSDIKCPSVSRENFGIYAKAAFNFILGSNPRKRLTFWNKEKNIDSIGQVDKIISNNDVRRWKDKIKKLGITD